MQAIISDIHSNYEALCAVLDNIESKGIKEIICIGDIVGYGPNPKECIDKAKDFYINILGNHDDAVLNEPSKDFSELAANAVNWTKGRLNDTADEQNATRWSFLKGLKDIAKYEDIMFVHGSPRNHLKEYILPNDVLSPKKKLEKIFGMIEGMCFVGHSHLPGIFTSDMEFMSPDEIINVYMRGKKKVIVNVGSVGQPRDNNNKACYVTFDGEAVVFRRVTYDFEKTANKIYEITALDKFLGDRLKAGR